MCRLVACLYKTGQKMVDGLRFVGGLCLLAKGLQAWDLTHPGGGSVTGSESHPSFLPAGAFDHGGILDAARWLPLQSELPNVFVQYDFGRAERVTKYSIRNQHFNHVPRSPLDWKLQGSADGSAWTDVDTVTGEMDWEIREEREFLVDTPGDYQHYKLVISAANGGDTYIGLLEVKLGVDFTDLPEVLKVDFGQHDTDPLQDGFQGFNPWGATSPDDGNPVSQEYDSFFATSGKVTVKMEGQTHWRDYSAMTGGNYQSLGNLLSDHVLMNADGTMALTLSGLKAGNYILRTYHHNTETTLGGGIFAATVSDSTRTDAAIAPDITQPGSSTAPEDILILTHSFNITDGDFVFKMTKKGGGNQMNLNGFELYSATPDLDPTITLNGDASIEHVLGEAFTDPGATATDTEDGSLTPVVTYEAPWSYPGALAADTYAGLQLWLKADEGFSPGSWSDQSGNGNDSNANGSPQLIDDAQNGLPLMRYSGADGEYHDFQEIADIRTVFWVAKRNAGEGFLLGHNNSFHFHSTTNFVWSQNNTHQNIRDGDLYFNGLPVDGLAVNIPSELSVISLRTTGDVAANRFNRDRNIGREWDGDLGELLIFNTALTDPQIADIERRLAVKWGLPHETSPLPAASFDPDILGIWTLTYTATDSVGQSVSVSREVDVRDPNAPVITLTDGDTVHHEQGTAFTDPGTTVQDKDGQTIDTTNNPVQVTGTVDPDIPGAYTLTYDFTDDQGGLAIPVTRTVNVSDTTPPTINLVGGETLKHAVGQPFADPGFSAMDIVDGEVEARTSLYEYDKIIHRGFTGGPSQATLDFSNNGGIFSATPSGEGYLTGRMDFNSDANFRSANVGLTANDRYRNLFTGYFHAKVAGQYEFGVTQEDDHGVFWLDLDQDGVFNPEGFAGNEWLNRDYASSTDVVTLQPGLYLFAAGHAENTGNSGYEAKFRTPDGAGPTTLSFIDPSDDAQKGLWLLKTPFDTATPGTHTVTYTATDAAGNTATLVRTVEVIDFSQQPVITLLGRAVLNHEQYTVFTDPGATVADADGNALDDSGILVSGSVDPDAPGRYDLVYRFYDSNGVPADPKTRTITVADTTVPAIELVGDAEIEHTQGQPFTDPGATLLPDPEEGLVLISTTSSFPTGNLWGHYDASRIEGAQPGSQILQWTDISGNNRHLSNVRGDPTLAADGINGVPAVHVDGNDFLAAVADVGRHHTVYTISRLDGAKNGRLISSFNRNWLLGYINGLEDTYHPEGWASLQETPASVDPHFYAATSTGSTHVQFYADGENLTVNPARNGRVGRFQVGGYRESSEGASGYVAEALLYNNRVHDESQRLRVQTLLCTKYGLLGYPQHPLPDFNQLGEHTIVYAVRDSAGNVGTITRKVTVVPDATLPVISLTGDSILTIEAGSAFTDPGVTVKDSAGQDIANPDVTITGSIDTSILGVQTLQYDFTDGDGNDALPIIRTVVVEDTTGPTITLTGDPVVRIQAGDAYTDAGATATDSISGDAFVWSDLNVPREGLVLHLDAASFTHRLNDGQNLNIAWEDLSPHRHHADSRNGDPNWKAAGVNGLPVVNFDGNDWVWTSHDFSGDLANNTVFSVARYTGGDNQAVIASRGLDWRFGYHNNSIRSYHPRGWVHQGTGSDTEWHVHIGDANDNDQANFWLDGVQLATNSNAMPGYDYFPSQIQLGARSTNRDTSKCEVAELLVYQRVLPAAERDALNAYLNSKYNLNGGGTPSHRFDNNTPGTYEVNYFSRDNLGNLSTTTRQIIVSPDTSKPYIALKGDPVDTIEADPVATYTDPGATAHAADGSVLDDTLQGQGTVDQATPGNYTLEYIYTDAANIHRAVQVRDTTVPVLTLAGPETVEVTIGTPYTEPGVTATDSLEGGLPAYSPYSSIPGRLEYQAFKHGNVTAYLDLEGNGGLLQMNPDAQGHFRPDPGAVGLNPGNDNEWDAFLKTDVGDNFQVGIFGTFHAKRDGDYQFETAGSGGGDLYAIWLDKDQDGVFERAGDKGDERINWDRILSLTPLESGVYRIAMLFSERTGNSRFEVRFSTPEGAGPFGLTHVNPSSPEQAGIWATWPNTLDTSTLGTQRIEYFAEDSSGNTGYAYRNVVVRPEPAKPVIHLLGELNLNSEGGMPFEDPGYLLDDHDGNPADEGLVQVSGVPDGSKVGTFTVLYEYTDADGREAKPRTRTVTVSDNLPPVITLNGLDEIVVPVGGAVVDPGATAFDLVDGVTLATSDAFFPMDGLRAWWDFNDGSGTTAKDAAGDNDAELVNFTGAEWVAGRFGGGLHFNPNDEGDQHVLAPAFEIGGALSVAAWVKYDELRNWCRIIDFGHGAGNHNLLLANNGTSDSATFQVRVGSNAINLTAPGFWVPETWIHVVATVGTDGVMRLYKDGELFAVNLGGQVPAVQTRAIQYIGRSNWTGNDNFHGVMDELLIYDRSIGEGEIQAILRGGDAFDTSTAGEHTITYRTRDFAGNVSTATRTVKVVDGATLPAITLLGGAELTIPAHEPYEDAGVTVADSDGNALGLANLVVQGDVDVATLGTYTLTYNFTTDGGESAPTVVREVTVVDQTPPAIQLVGGETIEHQLGNPFTDPGFSAVDAVEGEVPVQSSHLIPNHYRMQGFVFNVSQDITFDFPSGVDTLYQRTPVGETYRNQALDFGGDAAFRSALPAISRNDQYQTLFDGYFETRTGGRYEFGIIREDNYAAFWFDADGDGMFEDNGDNGPELMNPGWNAAFNEVEIPPGRYRFAVAHRETTGGTNVQAGYKALSGAGPGVRSTINPSNPLQEGQWMVWNPIDVLAPGEHTITYTSTDSAGNAATLVRTVIVKNNPEAGIITLAGDAEMEVALGSTFADPGASVADIDGIDLGLDNLVVTGGVDTAEIGEYELVYSFTTDAGIPSRMVTRTVTVSDQEAPSITLAGDAEVTVFQGSTYTDAGASATDNLDGEFVFLGTSENFPADGLVLHLDASSLIGKDEGDPVLDWPDLSTTGSHANISTGTPTYSADGLNGMPAVHFDGTSLLSIPSFVDNLYSIVTISRLGNVASQRLLSASDRNWALGYHGGAQGRFVLRNGWAANGVPSTTDPQLFSAISGNLRVNFYDNGRDTTTNPIRRDNNYRMGYFQMGGYLDGQENSVGYVSEVIIYNRILSNSERIGIEARLNAKYGLNGLTKAVTPVDTSKTGEYHVVYQSVDSAGNLATETRKVTVIPDPAAPVITLTGDAVLIFEAAPVYTDPGAVLTDKDGNVLDASLMAMDDQVVPTREGLYTYTYSYTPASGASAVPVARHVRVQDTTPPTVTLSGPDVVKLEVGATYTEDGASATDTATGTVPALSSLAYTYGRLAHNGYKGTRGDAWIDLSGGNRITDLTPAGTNFLTNGPGGRGLDFNNDGDFKNAGVGINQNDNYQNLFHGMFVAPATGSYTFQVFQENAGAAIWIDLDQDGSFEQPGDLGNERLLGPQGTGLAEVELQTGIYDFAIAHRGAGGTSTLDIRFGENGAIPVVLKPASAAHVPHFASKEPGTLDTSVAGTFTIEYTAYDAAGNHSKAVRTVVVVDDATLPFIAPNGGLETEHELGTPFTDPLATVTSGQTVLKDDLAGQGTVDASTLGEYILTYDYTDSGTGKIAETVTRKVVVVDTVAPVLTLVDFNGETETINLTVGDNWADPGVTLSDQDPAAWSVSSRQKLPNQLFMAATQGSTVTNAMTNFANHGGLLGITPVGSMVFTRGPNGVGYSFSNDADFRTLPIGITQNDKFSTYLTGYFHASVAGDYKFRTDGDNHMSFYIDLDQDGTYQNTPERLINGGGTRNTTVALTPGYHRFIVGHYENNGGSRGHFYFQTPEGGGHSAAFTLANPLAPSQAGLWSNPGDGAIDTTFPATYEITYHAFDTSGHSISISRTVIVEEDPDAPVLTLVGDAEIQHQVGSDYNDETPTIATPSGTPIDDQANIGHTFTHNGADVGSLDKDIAGTYLIQYDYTDGSSRKAIPVFRTVIVGDFLPPQITLLGDNPLQITPGFPYLEPGATATDDPDGDLTVNLPTADFPTNAEATFTLTYSVTDAAGNTATATREVIIKDDPNRPIIQLDRETTLTHEAGEPFVEPGFTLTNGRGHDLDEADVTITGTVDHTALGTYTLVYSATNASTIQREVTVVDTTPPVIELTGGNNLRWDIGTPWADPGHSATDNLDPSVTVQVTFLATGLQPILHYEFDNTSGTVAEESKAGIDGTLTNFPDPDAAWVAGKYGNALSFDGVASHIVIPGTDKLDLQAITISLWVKTDDYNRSMFLFEKTANNTVNSQYNLFLESDNTFTFRIIDDGSNINNVSIPSAANFLPDIWQHIAVTYDGADQSVYVEGELVGTASPTATVAANPAGKSYIGANAPGDGYYYNGLIDDLKVYNIAVTEAQIPDIQKQSGLLTDAEQKVPPYTLEYTATDTAGHTTTVQRKVVVSNDSTPPTISLTGDNPLQVDLNSSFTDPGFTASDNIDGSITTALVEVTGIVDTSKLGTYTLTYTLTDLSFNTATVTRTVNVTDPTPTNAFDTWTADKLGSLAPAKQDPEADPDHDRVPNLLEYAIGGNPTSPDRKDTLPEVDANSGSLTITFLRVKASVDPSLTYKVELTRKLKNATWSEADVTVTVDADQTGVPTDYERVTATANTPIANETQKRQFIRVTVER